ncbi:MAG: hypothetical protein HW384_2150 [Dehalococcoidia bacterium]|nr:hypothetical protein [Dehalococcoidia bacterium]
MVLQKRQFIVDEKGRKKAVLLPIREYQELMEDLEDLAIIAERREEPKRLETEWQFPKSK